MEPQEIIELAADIVASHVSNNHVSINDLAGLITSVHGALAGLGSAREEEPAQKTPVVSARASVKPDYLVCMECGKKQKTLKRHLMTAHGMTPEQYRSDFGLGRDYPMTAPNYSEQRRGMAKSIGLGRKRKTRNGNGETAPEAPAASVEAGNAPAGPKRKTKNGNGNGETAPVEALASSVPTKKAPARRKRGKPAST